jgi:hypothetical protein
MHAHDFDTGGAVSPHLSVSRQVDEADPAALRAASAGHAEALNPSALLNLQRLAGNASVSSLVGEDVEESSPVRDVVNSGGEAPIESSTRTYMAYRLGSDFGDHSGHTDELTHVVQQRSGPVAGTPAAGGIRLSDPSDPFEQAAERTAATALTPSSATSGAGEASVQRAGEEEEEETAQTLVAQRAGEEEEEEQA